MALKYCTLAELNSYIGSSGVDALVTQLATGAEALFDNLIGWGLEDKSHTTYFEPAYSANGYNTGKVFFLPANNITAVSTVNGVSAGAINVDYTISLQKLEFQYAKNLPNTFPYRYTIVYQAGYATIPDDVKLAISAITEAFYNQHNTNGIESYRQDLLTVKYQTASILDDIMDSDKRTFLQWIINKYKIHTVIA